MNFRHQYYNTRRGDPVACYGLRGLNKEFLLFITRNA